MPEGRDDELLRQIVVSGEQWARVYEREAARAAKLEAENAELRALLAAQRERIGHLERDNARLRAVPADVVKERNGLWLDVIKVFRAITAKISQVASGRIGYTLSVILLVTLILWLETCTGVQPADVKELLDAVLP